MFANANLKCGLVACAMALVPALVMADPAAGEAERPTAERVHVDLGLFDTVIDARRAWATIIETDDSLLRFDPIFGRYQDRTTANVFFIAPNDAAAVCRAAQRSAAETCKQID